MFTFVLHCTGGKNLQDYSIILDYKRNQNHNQESLLQVNVINYNRILFNQTYNIELQKLFREIKAKTREYKNTCYCGNGFISLLFAVPKNENCNVRYSSFLVEDGIYENQDTMRRYYEGKKIIMEKQLKEVNEKIASTSSLQKLLAFIF